MDNLDYRVSQAQGFVSANIEMPFDLVPVVLAQREGARDQLIEIGESLEKRLEIDQTFEFIKKRGFSYIASLFSKRILGLYCPDYLDQGRDRLILVPENIQNVSAQLGIEYDTFFTWVLTHEMMHIAQFNYGTRELSRAILEQVSGVLKKDLDVGQLKATMTWAEGSADFIMDRPGLIEKSEIEKMREKIDLKRQQINFFNILLRLLGNKTGQYLDGHRFSRNVAEKIGPAAIALPIQNPVFLPTGEEIKDPDIWISRVSR